MGTRITESSGYWVVYRGIEHYIPDRSTFRITFEGQEERAACGRFVPYLSDGSDAERFDPRHQTRFVCAGCLGYRD